MNTGRNVFKIRLKKGDTVKVRVGKYKGKTGKIVAVHPSLNAVSVEGINIVKKHVKPNREYPQGAIVDLTKPIAVSKLALVDSSAKDGKTVKIGYKVDKDGSKVRINKVTGKELK